MTVVGCVVSNPEYPEIGGRPNTILLCYKLTEEEREKLLRGDHLYLHMLTFGGNLQPHILSVGTDHLEQMYGVKVTP